ncbi:MAG: hypothetical protein AVDCRST_MAG36-2130, partial [uncultured Nocardioidaceae bacterium]
APRRAPAAGAVHASPVPRPGPGVVHRRCCGCGRGCTPHSPAL